MKKREIRCAGTYQWGVSLLSDPVLQKVIESHEYRGELITVGMLTLFVQIFVTFSLTSNEEKLKELKKKQLVQTRNNNWARMTVSYTKFLYEFSLKFFDMKKLQIGFMFIAIYSLKLNQWTATDSQWLFTASSSY